MKARALGAVLGLMLAAVGISVAAERWPASVFPIALGGLGLGLLCEGTALVANWLADSERRERAELHRGETR